MSYTRFKYGKPHLRGWHKKRIVVRVRNAGDREGTEVIQLYVCKEGDGNGPQKTLRAFKRVTIPAHRSRRVVIPLDDETFSWWSDEARNMVPSPGNYVLMVGSSSAPEDLKSLEINRK